MRNALREGGRTDGRQNRYGDIDTAMSDHGGKRQDTHSVTRPPAGSPELEREAVRPGRRKQANPGGKRPRCEERGLRGFAGVLAENYVCRDDTWSRKLPDAHLGRSGEGPEERTPVSRPGERLVASRPSCVSRKLLRA